MKKGKASVSTQPKPNRQKLPKLGKAKGKGSKKDSKSDLHILNLEKENDLYRRKIRKLQSISLNPRLDKVTGETMSVLIKEYDSLSAKLHEGEKHMHGLKISLRSLSESISATRKKVGGGTEFERQESLFKKVLVLENRLENSHKKINQSIMANKKSCEEIEQCKAAKALFLKLKKEMKRDMKRKQKKIDELIQQSEAVSKIRQGVEKELKSVRNKCKKVEKNYEKKAKIMDSILSRDEEVNNVLKLKQGAERNSLEKKTLLLEGKIRKDEKYKKELFDMIFKTEGARAILSQIEAAADELNNGEMKQVKDGVHELNSLMGVVSNATNDDDAGTRRDVLLSLKTLDRSLVNLAKGNKLPSSTTAQAASGKAEKKGKK